MPGVGLIDTVSSTAPADGSASATKQDEQIQQLQDVLTALGLVATEDTAGEIRDAVVALGGGKSLDDLATALASIATNTAAGATQVTAAAILAELTAQGVDIDTVVSTLATIENEVDDLEALITATNTKLDTLITALAPVSSGGNYKQTATGSAVALGNHAAVQGVMVLADDANTPTVYVGFSGIDATTGFPLAAGDSKFFRVSNSNIIYILAASGSPVVRYEVT